MMNLWFNAPHGPLRPRAEAPHSRRRAAAELPGFNEKDISDKPGWLRKQAGADSSNGQEGDRGRAKAANGAAALGRRGGRPDRQRPRGPRPADDTYIVFASDNGFFRGEHRIAGGKYLPYEPSSRVPLVIRGPGVSRREPVTSWSPRSTSRRRSSTSRGGATDPALDGRSLLPYAQNPALRSARPLLLEGDTGPGNGQPRHRSRRRRAPPARSRRSGASLARKPRREGPRSGEDPSPSLALTNGNSAPAYRAIRTDRYLYVLYANGQTELYDMKRDPAQQLAAQRTGATGRSASASTPRWSRSATAPVLHAGSRSGPEPAPLPKAGRGRSPPRRSAARVRR